MISPNYLHFIPQRESIKVAILNITHSKDASFTSRRRRRGLRFSQRRSCSEYVIQVSVNAFNGADATLAANDDALAAVKDIQGKMENLVEFLKRDG